MMQGMQSILQAGYGLSPAASRPVAGLSSLSTESTDESPLSAAALFIVDFIRQSSALSGNDKESLIGLTALVDSYGGENAAELLEAIATIVMMMETVNRARDEDVQWNATIMTKEDAIATFEQVRTRFVADEDMQLSIGASVQAMMADQESQVAQLV